MKMDYVITLCGAAGGERCPFFPGAGGRLHREFSDPSALQGHMKKPAGTVRIRGGIKAGIKERIRSL